GVLTGGVPVRQGEVIPPHPPAVTARASAAAARARRPRGRRTTVIGTPPTSPSAPHWGAHTGHDKRDRADRGGPTDRIGAQEQAGRRGRSAACRPHPPGVPVPCPMRPFVVRPPSVCSGPAAESAQPDRLRRGEGFAQMCQLPRRAAQSVARDCARCERGPLLAVGMTDRPSCAASAKPCRLPGPTGPPHRIHDTERQGVQVKRRLAVAGLSLVVAMGTVALPAVTTARTAADRGTTAAAADPKLVDRAVAAADKVTSSGFDALAKGPDERYDRTMVTPWGKGLYSIAYERTYRGLPVVGGDAVVLADGDGDVRAASDVRIPVGTEAKVKAASAARTSRAKLKKTEGT